ncbi:hypothetical protein HNQ59_003126 [Chitinivorax tropicus]|uniref:DUF2834 domain-containing protein n=1 Tax=Chitinivorax tropicus TaxID=714531 RepID=A0A840MMF8_9PROT|nr:DUF2834 domain-containing protein [Chitinivorax tropicus]MBB5019818.1 hypothetical protein [Chitinivorax tropicus]
MKNIYLALCVLGLVVPYICFAPWLGSNGLAIDLLLSQAFSSPVSAFAWADVALSGLALLAFVAHEQRRRQVRGVWLVCVGLFTVGVSFALPLYLYLRTRDTSA